MSMAVTRGWWSSEFRVYFSQDGGRWREEGDDEVDLRAAPPGGAGEVRLDVEVAR